MNEPVPNHDERKPQLAYSELQDFTYDEAKRRRKAAKIVAVLSHFLGTDDWSCLSVVDVGCSTGYTVDALQETGAEVIGLDIDVPGLAHANARFGHGGSFLCADGRAMPFPDRSVDVLIFNHIYEHVVDPDAVLADILRVLRPDGVAYFGFGNRWQVMEPHYRLPFLSWLPRGAADKYVAASGRASEYYERFRSRRQLTLMCQPLNLWDYTYTVLADAKLFRATDLVPGALQGLPAGLWSGLAPIVPTFIWVGTPGTRAPAGAATRRRPRRLRPAPVG